MGESPRQENHLSRGPQSDRLDSWKEIAAYLDRDVRTVIRWEKNEGLPVHRHIHHKQATVYAFCSEIEVWQKKRRGSDFEQEELRGRLFGGNKKIAAGIAVGLAFIVLAPLLWLASPDLPSPKTESLNFQERDWVMVADFENRTGEAVFDGVLESALRREIANSQFVNVVPPERIADNLRLMRKPLDTPIDPEVAREIGMRDGGIKALLTGRVEKLDSTYLLSMELLDPMTGQGIAATSEEAVGQKQVLSALRALSNWARENLGEKLALIQENEQKLEKVTTPSLEALQLFTKADALISQGRSDLSEELLKQAVDIDPEFASAHMHLAHATRNQRKPAEEYLPHAERALRLAQTTADRERYFIEGSYYHMKGEDEKAAHAYETLLTLYPDHFWAIGNLTGIYQSLGEWKKVLPHSLQRVEQRPTDLSSHLLVASTLIFVDGHSIRARPYMERARNLLTRELIREGRGLVMRTLLFPAYEAWFDGDPQRALVEIDGVLKRLERLGISNSRVVPLGALYSALGKRQLARRWIGSDLDGQGQHWTLAVIAYSEGDETELANQLRQFLKPGNDHGYRASLSGIQGTPQTALLLAEAGFLPESEEILAQLQRRQSSDPLRQPQRALMQLARGVLELRKGNSREGVRLIQDYLEEGGELYNSSQFLAQAWRQEGELQRAIRVLEEVSKEKHLVLAPFASEKPIMWLRIQASLAELYREAGLEKVARETEDNLRRHLAYADPGHPILQELDGKGERETTSASLSSSSN